MKVTNYFFHNCTNCSFLLDLIYPTDLNDFRFISPAIQPSQNNRLVLFGSLIPFTIASCRSYFNRLLTYMPSLKCQISASLNLAIFTIATDACSEQAASQSS